MPVDGINGVNDGQSGEVLAAASQIWMNRAKTLERQELRRAAINLLQVWIFDAERLAEVLDAVCQREAKAA
jgi:hypothetical protein